MNKGDTIEGNFEKGNPKGICKIKIGDKEGEREFWSKKKFQPIKSFQLMFFYFLVVGLVLLYFLIFYLPKKPKYYKQSKRKKKNKLIFTRYK